MKAADNSFSNDFCLHLEYHLSRTFKRSADTKLNWFWCDGVQMPDNENQLDWENICQSKKIETRAWIGTTGQDVYSMTIKLGPQSLVKYADHQSLLECIPPDNSFEWLTIDADAMTIELQLK